MRNTWLYHKLLRDTRPKSEYYANERGKRNLNLLLCILVCFLAFFYLLGIYGARLCKAIFCWIQRQVA